MNIHKENLLVKLFDYDDIKNTVKINVEIDNKMKNDEINRLITNINILNNSIENLRKEYDKKMIKFQNLQKDLKTLYRELFYVEKEENISIQKKNQLIKENIVSYLKLIKVFFNLINNYFN